MFLGCQSLFIRHTESKKCIKAGKSFSFKDEKDYAVRYWAEMVDNCLDVYAQFRYLSNKPLLRNIETGGTLSSYYELSKYNKSVFVYDGINDIAIGYENDDRNNLKQKPTRSLYFDHKEERTCAQPNGKYVDAKQDGCTDASVQKFTFGKGMFNFSELLYYIS